jgi:hypothetical protein
MLRDASATAPIRFDTPAGPRTTGGGGPPGTRQMFPQASADLRVRWCSAYLKIDVMDAAIRGQSRFKESRTLVVTGERAQESANRARYKMLETHRADARGPRLRRHVDAWRPILHWHEEDVWNIIQAHEIRPHPAYYLGWGRLSCMTCIFGSANQWASAPDRISEIAAFEQRFGKTIHRTKSVRDRIKDGQPYAAIITSDPKYLAAALSPRDTWDSDALPLRVPISEWKLPAGAFGENAGPT